MGDDVIIWGHDSLIIKRKCDVVLFSNQKGLFSSGKKNESLSSESVFLHFNEDPFLPFRDLRHLIIVKLLPGDLFLMKSTWLKNKLNVK